MNHLLLNFGFKLLFYLIISSVGIEYFDIHFSLTKYKINIYEK